MTQQDVEAKVKRAVELFRLQAPRRPGVVLKHPNRPVTDNLKRNAIKLEKIEGGYRIFVDEAVAPYMPFTNEKWVSPKWKGAKNPNEKWWEQECEALIKYLAVELGGILKIGGSE